MVYELELYPDAQEQIDALPPEVRAALGRAMTVLALVPWNGLPYNGVTGPDGYGSRTMIAASERPISWSWSDQ